MLNSLTAAVEGLNVEQQALDVVGGNLANINTPGYKANLINFKEAFSQVYQQASGPSGNLGSINPIQIGLGVNVGTENSLYTQGAVNVTGSNTDMAISGSGFFGVQGSDGTMGYTRNGNFSLDVDGNLVNNNGMKVVGWNGSGGVVNTTTATSPLVVKLGQTSIAEATQNMAYSGNLDGSLTTYNTPTTGCAIQAGSVLDKNAAVGTKVEITADTWVDNVGNKHTITYDFVRTSDPNLDAVGGASTDPTWQLTINGVDNSGAWINPPAPDKYSFRFDATTGALKFVNDDTISNPTGLAVPPAPTTGAGGSTVYDNATTPGTPTGAKNFNLNIACIGPLGTSVTQTVSLDFSNLSSGTAGLVSAAQTGGHSVQQVCSSQIYDSLGVQHTVDVTYTKGQLPAGSTDAGYWFWTARVDGELPQTLSGAGYGKLVFKADGSIDNSQVGAAGAPLTTLNPQVSFDPSKCPSPKNDTASAMIIKLDFSGITQLAGNNNPIVMRTQDGKPTGTLQNFSVGIDGTIDGQFSNGLTSALGRVALWTFTNVEGLTKSANGVLLESPASGSAVVGFAGTDGSAGTITGGALEGSNVDISTEFTQMITAQRAFQANAKMVSTVDDILNELANLKR